MSLLKKYQWPLFWILCAVIGLLLSYQVWSLRGLYLDPAMRTYVKDLIEEQSAVTGIVRSDFMPVYVAKNQVHLCHRQHQRGRDPVICEDFFMTNISDLP